MKKKESRYHKLAHLTVAGVAALLAAGCGKLDGSYADKTGIFQIDFKSGDKANLNTMGGKIEVDYEINGKEVKVKSPQGTMIATVADDGCLDFGGLFGKVCKKK